MNAGQAIYLDTPMYRLYPLNSTTIIGDVDVIRLDGTGSNSQTIVGTLNVKNSITMSDNYHVPGDVYVQNGGLNVSSNRSLATDGDFRIQSKNEDGTFGESNGYVRLHDNTELTVYGDFYTQTTNSEVFGYGSSSAPSILELHGNFSQIGTNTYYRHGSVSYLRTIFAGDGEQHISFERYDSNADLGKIEVLNAGQVVYLDTSMYRLYPLNDFNIIGDVEIQYLNGSDNYLNIYGSLIAKYPITINHNLSVNNDAVIDTAVYLEKRLNIEGNLRVQKLLSDGTYDTTTGFISVSSGAYLSVCGNPYRYSGEYYDAESGYIYLRARYYDSVTGRFISEDPAFDGANWYAYCGGNPLNRWDPSGQAWYDWVPGALAITAGTIMCATGFGTPIGVGLIVGGASSLSASALGAAGFDSKFVSMATAGIDVVGGTALLMTPFAPIGAGMIGSGFGALAGGAISEKLGGSYELGANIGSIVGGAVGGAVYGKISEMKKISEIEKISAMKSSNKVCNPNCFVAGTMIETADGKKPIEEIRVGSIVLAENSETGEIALKRVVRTFENESNELVHVFVNSEEIIATPSHPFYVPKLGWTSAIKLRAGDILVLSNGEYVVVESVQHEILESPVKVYNFEVEDFHTYFVGESSVLVHNKCAEGSSFIDMMSPDDAAKYAAHWKKDAPNFNTPNSKITHYKEHNGVIEKSIVIYDDYGRQKWRIDYNNHGYSNHSIPHLHERVFGIGYDLIKGKEDRYDIWNW